MKKDMKTPSKNKYKGNEEFWAKQGQRLFVRFLHHMATKKECLYCNHTFKEPVRKYDGKDWTNMISPDVWVHFHQTHGLPAQDFPEELNRYFAKNDKAIL